MELDEEEMKIFDNVETNILFGSLIDAYFLANENHERNLILSVISFMHTKRDDSPDLTDFYVQLIYSIENDEHKSYISLAICEFAKMLRSYSTHESIIEIIDVFEKIDHIIGNLDPDIECALSYELSTANEVIKSHYLQKSQQIMFDKIHEDQIKNKEVINDNIKTMH